MPQITVSIHGPLLKGNGPKEVHEALSKAIVDLATEGQMQVRQQLYVGHGRITGHYRGSVHAELTDSLHGRIHDSGVVYGPWLEGVGSRNEKSRFKGFAMFRNAKQALEKLKEGIVQKRIHEVVKKLGG